LTMQLGREADNDIVLDYPDVSRYHLALHFDGQTCRVSDQGTTNGTRLDALPLVPREPVVWSPEQVLHIGRLRLQLQVGDHAPPLPPDQQTVATGVEPVSQLAGSQFEISVEPAQILATPGQPTIATIRINNTLTTADTFHISIDGISPSWVLDLPQTVTIARQDQKDVRFTLHPPLDPRTRAGRHRLNITVMAQQADQTQTLTRTLTVSAFSHYQAALWPEVIRAGKKGQVTIQNRGNTPQTYTIAFTGQGDELTFNPPQGQLQIGPGQAESAEFLAELRRPSLLGGSRSHTYAMRITSSDGQLQTHNGTVASRGLIPVWVLSVLIFACLILTVVGAFAYSIRNARIAEGTQTAVALVTAPIATQAAQATAQQATLEAATATANYLAQDDDRDGLSNEVEQQLGTRPDKRDTDEDGLDDGDEVERKTNPLRADTDGDGLRDGDEVSRGIDPLKVDTDGDGTPDATDPDPGRLPTATPGPTATATPINVPPVIALTEPTAGTTYLAPASLTLVAAPADEDGTIARVDFFAGPVLIGSATQPPFRITWQNVSAGTYALTAQATDDDGAKATSAAVNITVAEPANAPPSINIAEPLTGAIFEAGGSVPIAALADDIDGRVVEVQFYAGTTLLETINSRRIRYEYTWQNVVVGSYALSALAIDDDGATTTSDLVTITVNPPPNNPPTITLTAPQAGQTFSLTQTITLAATANDVDGTVTEVEFFANGTSIGSGSTPPDGPTIPYSLTWTAPNTGSYVITADASDDDDDSTTSAAVTISVLP
jgi:hypothetical protein